MLASTVKEIARDFNGGATQQKLARTHGVGVKQVFQALLRARRQGSVDDSAFSKIVLEREEHVFSKDPESRLEAVLSSTNTEFKQAAIIMLKPYPMSGRDIAAAVRENLPTVSNLLPKSSQSFAFYCRDTLVPIGLLARETLRKGNRKAVHFTLSPAGKKFGQPIAAYCLRYGVDHDVSLFQWLGDAMSAGISRGPYNRARITELLAEGMNTISSLSRHLHLGTTDIREHLTRLQHAELLSFHSAGERDQHTYTWIAHKRPEDVPTFELYPSLTGRVATCLRDHSSGTLNSIGKRLCASPKWVSSVLVHLANKGFAATTYEGGKSSISLLEKGYDFLEFVRKLRTALSGKSALKEMRGLQREFFEEPGLFREYLEAGIENYHAVSPRLHKAPFSVRASAIVDYIEGYLKDLGPKSKEIGAAVGLRNVSWYLRRMAEAGTIEKTIHGREARWRIPHP